MQLYATTMDLQAVCNRLRNRSERLPRQVGAARCSTFSACCLYCKRAHYSSGGPPGRFAACCDSTAVDQVGACIGQDIKVGKPAMPQCCLAVRSPEVGSPFWVFLLRRCCRFLRSAYLAASKKTCLGLLGRSEAISASSCRSSGGGAACLCHSHRHKDMGLAVDVKPGALAPQDAYDRLREATASGAHRRRFIVETKFDSEQASAIPLPFRTTSARVVEDENDKRAAQQQCPCFAVLLRL